MTSFQIPEGPSRIEAFAGQPTADAATFTVTNNAGEAIRGRLAVQVTGEAHADWFAIDGERERRFASGESQTAAVRINVPQGVSPGEYRFRLRIVAINDPDNDFADGPPVALVVKVATAPAPMIWPYILGAILLLIVVGGGLYVFLKPDKPDDRPPPVVSATMPDLLAAPIDETEARKRLAAIDSSLDIETRPVERSDVGPLTVVAQAPAAGQPLAKGAPVRLTIAYPWFVGTWTGTIDGRPATLRWRIVVEGDVRRMVGDFSDGSTGRYVPMTYEAHNAQQLFLQHPDGNHWFLARTGEGQARGHTTWGGRQFPLVMNRQSLTVDP